MIETACWIACPETVEVPNIYKNINLEQPKSGFIEITGLGFFSLFINGKRVTENCFVPALTNYESRDMSNWAYPIFDIMTHRILYLTYDITSFIKDGENEIKIQLAPGWYRQKERVAEGHMSFGNMLKTIFAAEFICENERKVRICSDGTEQWKPSEIIYSCLFVGEVHDARLITKEFLPQPVEVIETPNTIMQEQTCPPDCIIRTIIPKLIVENDDFKLYDIGENTTIRVCVTAGGKLGDEINLVYGESINDKYELDVGSCGAYNKRSNGLEQIQQDTFICSENKHNFCSTYVWHGCRYIKVEGDVDEIFVQVVHTNVSITSQFDCDNETLNWLYNAYIRTQLGNIHNCIPSDCPHRERLGYTGDGQITAKTAMMVLDMKHVYRKWIQDILDCQDIISGHVQHTAPFMGGGGGPGGWGCAIIIIPDEYDKHYDDKFFLEKCYPYMQKWIAYMKGHSEGDLLVREEPHGWCLGDWATMHPTCIPEVYVNSCYMLDAFKRMERISNRLGYTSDSFVYRQLGNRTRSALRKMFYDVDTGSFCGGVQGADAFAVWMNLQDESDKRTLTNLVSKYQKLDYFDTGFLGTEILIKVLVEQGHVDTAYQLLTSKKIGSYHYMKESGATTLWEYLDGNFSDCPGSLNHPMFGAPVLHLFDSFLGIQQSEHSIGYKELKIAPKIPKDMKYARGSVQLPCGRASVSWECLDNYIMLNITVPHNVPAVCEMDGKLYTLRSGENILKF